MSAGSIRLCRRPSGAAASVVVHAVLAVMLSACAAQGSSSLQATVPASGAPVASPMATGTPGAGPSKEADRPSLPAGFPVPPGAITLPPPADDASVIARWMLAMEGSGPYEALLAALPAAGFQVVGGYPADQAALIRFEVRDGTIWQVLLEHREGGTLMTVQTDRP
jgi:hypothetical protein